MTQLLVKTIADFSTTLVNKTAVGATTATLTSGLDADGIQLPTGTYGFTIDRNNSSKEHFTATLTGTALTNIQTVTRGTGAGTSGLVRVHRKGAEVIITDHVSLKRMMNVLDGTTDLDGATALKYDSTPTINNNLQLATKAYVDSVASGSATLTNVAVVEEGIAGETVALGHLMYFSETDNEWLKTDADTLATLFNVKLGIAQGAGTDGNAILGGVLTRGYFTTSGLTKGDIIYASNTAGAFSATVGTVPRVIGIAKDSTHLYFDPDFQNRLYDYAVDAVGTDSYAITLPSALSVPFVGMEIKFKAGTANTGAATLAINGGSAVAITKNGAVALDTGDIVSNQVLKVVYDGTQWQLITSPVFSNSSVTLRGVSEEATQAEIDAQTAVGATGARLFVNPSTTRNKVYLSTTEATFSSGNGGSGANVETTVFSTTVPAGMLGTNNGVKFKMYVTGAGIAGTSSAWTVRIKFGGTTYISLTNTSPNNAQSGMQGYLEGYVLADGATNAQKITASMFLAASSAETATDPSIIMSKSYFSNSVGAGNKDSTAAQTLDITVQMTNSANNNGVFEWFILESIM